MPESRSNRNRDRSRKRRSRKREEVQSTYKSDYMAKIPPSVLYGTCFVMSIFGLSFVIVAGVHMGECNIEKMIPIWLLIMGLFLIMASIWLALQGRRRSNTPGYKSNGIQRIVNIFVYIFFLIWFIIGNVFIYKSWADDPDFGHYWFENACDKSLFYLSFVSIIVFDIIVGIGAIALCCWILSQFVVKE